MADEQKKEGTIEQDSKNADEIIYLVGKILAFFHI